MHTDLRLEMGIFASGLLLVSGGCRSPPNPVSGVIVLPPQRQSMEIRPQVLSELDGYLNRTWCDEDVQSRS